MSITYNPVTDSFLLSFFLLTIKQHKHHVKMVALMLKLLTEAITEESTGYYRGVNRLLFRSQQATTDEKTNTCTG